MNVIHFTRHYPTTSETFVQRFVDKTGQQKVLTLSDNSDEKKFLEVPAKYYDRSKPAELFKYIKDKVSKTKIWEKYILNVLDKECDDLVVHVHFGDMGVLFAELVEKFNLKQPFITTFYGFDCSSLPAENPVYKKRLPHLFEQGTAFFAEGPALGEKLVALGCPREKVLVNPLIIPTQDIPQRKANQISEVIQFLMIGRFVEKKGFHLALEAVGQLKGEIPDFLVDIIGFGNMEDNYREIIDRYDLNDQVNFLGKKNHQEVLEALATHDYFCTLHSLQPMGTQKEEPLPSSLKHRRPSFR